MRCKRIQPPAETLIEGLRAVDPKPERSTPVFETLPLRELLTKAASRRTDAVPELPHDQP
jgi:hypothetical protein